MPVGRTMYRVLIKSTVDNPWLTMKPIRVGPTRLWRRTPNRFVLVEHHNTPFARIDVYWEYDGPFCDAILWRELVAIGCNSAAHLVDPKSGATRTFPCDWYFGHFYPLQDCLLVTSASEIFCVDARGERLWDASNLGIDGVVVDRVENGKLFGQGEWNPPGEWRPFQLSLESGQRISKE